ncbi:hypothetical protein E2C01_081437 [Portunus trituberculatus]|uniref:Uncharacterized protein n=1 Tax=Portunus trituberculatus TaxID=210409 RepID=A0A5B7IWC2_PORTR|nr:hypothetical protein [Portunus trituberculatus]
MEENEWKVEKEDEKKNRTGLKPKHVSEGEQDRPQAPTTTITTTSTATITTITKQPQPHSHSASASPPLHSSSQPLPLIKRVSHKIGDAIGASLATRHQQRSEGTRTTALTFSSLNSLSPKISLSLHLSNISKTPNHFR